MVGRRVRKKQGGKTKGPAGDKEIAGVVVQLLGPAEKADRQYNKGKQGQDNG